jgi:hypothetical protein
MPASIRSLLCLIACAACGGPGGGTPPGDDTLDVDAPVVSQLDPADCTAIAQNFVTAAQTCGTQLPGGAQAQLETMCKKGIASAELCGGNPTAGFDCFATFDSTDWVCAAGEPFPACNGDLAASLGMYCVLALGNPSCASGIRCEFDADCGGAECNGATGQCFDKGAFCVGLPCEFDADCPTGQTCNGAERACVGE